MGRPNTGWFPAEPYVTLERARELLDLDDITMELVRQWLTLRRRHLIGTDEAPVYRLAAVEEALLDLEHHEQRRAA